MNHKEIYFGKDGKDRIKTGVDAVANAVKTTLGPKGRTVLIDRGEFYANKITKDGVSVAREVALEDPVEDMGAKAVKEAAGKTVEAVGDGTTTSTILTQAIFNGGLSELYAGGNDLAQRITAMENGQGLINPVEMKKGIDKAVDKVCEAIDAYADPVGESIEAIRNVAVISTNNDEELGGIIADGIEKVGSDGVLIAEDAKDATTTLEVREGFQFDNGWIFPHFANQPNGEAVYKNPYILVCGEEVSEMGHIVPLLEEICERQKRAILIIATDVNGDAMSTLMINRTQAKIPVVPVRAVGRGDHMKEFLEDVAVVTGGDPIAEEFGLILEHADVEHLGQAKKIIVSKNSTMIIGGKGDPEALEEHTERIRGLKDSADTDFEKKRLEKRIARLSGGIGVIRVGAHTEQEAKEKLDRIDDAIHAVKAAAEGGVVAGGGVALLHATTALEGLTGNTQSESVGISIVREAIKAPFLQIVANTSGEQNEEAISRVLKESFKYGYNAKTEIYEDLVEAGVIDPAKVVKLALKNAASAAGMLLTTECIIAEPREEEPQKS